MNKSEQTFWFEIVGDLPTTTDSDVVAEFQRRRRQEDLSHGEVYHLMWLARLLHVPYHYGYMHPEELT